MVKEVEGNTFKDNIPNNLNKDIEDMINRKVESLQEKSVSSLEKAKSIFNNELQVLRKELESKNQVINKLLETIENIRNKAFNLTHCQSRNLTLKTTQMIQMNLREKRDSQQEINNFSLGKTDSIEKQLSDVKIKKEKNIIDLKATFKVILLKKI